MNQNKLKIIKIDSIPHYYVFNTLGDSQQEVIVLAEIGVMQECLPFKKYIIIDSLRQVESIKSGNTNKDLVYYLSTVNGVLIRKENQLVNMIYNCRCFVNEE